MQKTIQNLTKAFVGESQARNRYTFYATVAKKEGYEQISAIFTDTAEQEKAHSKRLFEYLQELKKGGGEIINEIAVEVEASLVYGETAENLAGAIAGETAEYTQIYPNFATIADEENLPEIATRLRAIAKAEQHHKERFEKLLEQLEAGALFKKEQEVVWACRECGYIHIGKEAPQKCPSCDHPQAYYQIQCENY